jgi:hypothetical protein|tara:strand:- start:38 stop:340 length:303 start_codon:yes stop_codon:yes gene_type:complete
MLKAKYVLEVVHCNSYEEVGRWGKLTHIGYMMGRFKTKKDAVSYYDRHNPHMRSLNLYNDYCSDWDPVTNLIYIVRNDYSITLTVDCFTIADNNCLVWLK